MTGSEAFWHRHARLRTGRVLLVATHLVMPRVLSRLTSLADTSDDAAMVRLSPASASSLLQLETRGMARASAASSLFSPAILVESGGPDGAPSTRLFPDRASGSLSRDPWTARDVSGALVWTTSPPLMDITWAVRRLVWRRRRVNMLFEVLVEIVPSAAKAPVREGMDTK